MINEEEIERSQQNLDRLIEEVQQIVVGHQEVIQTGIVAVLSRGHLLLEGVPGLGKTLLVRTLASAMDLEYSRIQFTPDLMPADIIGTNVLQETNGKREFTFSPGPVFANLILADEINRATPKTQAALLEAMEEGTVSVGNTIHELKLPFTLMATQNPIEMEGTYPLPESQVDRFAFKVDVSYPNQTELEEITARNTEDGGLVLPDPIISGEDLSLSQEIVAQIPVPQQLRSYVSSLVVATNPDREQAPAAVKDYVEYGASPRGALSLIRGAKAHAFLDGEYNVSRANIQKVFLPAMRHRLILSFKAEAEGIEVEEILEEVRSEVTV